MNGKAYIAGGSVGQSVSRGIAVVDSAGIKACRAVITEVSAHEHVYLDVIPQEPQWISVECPVTFQVISNTSWIVR